MTLLLRKLKLFLSDIIFLSKKEVILSCKETSSLCKTSSISGALNVLHVGIRILLQSVYGRLSLPVWSCGHACLTGPLIDVYSKPCVTCTGSHTVAGCIDRNVTMPPSHNTDYIIIMFPI